MQNEKEEKMLTPYMILQSFQHICQSQLCLPDIQENLHHGVHWLWASSMKSAQLHPIPASNWVSKPMENNLLALSQMECSTNLKNQKTIIVQINPLPFQFLGDLSEIAWTIIYVILRGVISKCNPGDYKITSWNSIIVAIILQ